MTRFSLGDVLGTNYVPTHNETRLITTEIELKKQELSSLNDIIAPLLAKRDKLEDDILAHKALLTPARRLPPELVREVFTHAVNDKSSELGRNNDSVHRFAIPSGKEAPLVLGQICRLWRKIVLSSPSLWSTLSIRGSFSIEGLQEWIARSGSCNVSFSLLLRPDNIGVLKVLASCQQRWTDVVLQVSFDSFHANEFKPKFLESLSPEYRNLQTLEIGACTDIPLVIGSAPNLRHLIVRDPWIKVTAPSLDDSPALFLREIDAKCNPRMRSADLLALLRLSPSVEVITAYVEDSFDRDEIHRDILTLPALKRMVISGRHLKGANFCVLARLYSPALEDLSFFSWSYGSYPPQIRSLIHRSRPPLKLLRIGGRQPFPSIDVIECLPFLPLLSTLHLEETDGELDGLINALTGPIPSSNDLSGCICPELNEIYLNPSDDTLHTDSELVINMVLSRSPSGRSRLAQVTVLSCPESEVLADPRIIDCIENGLEFKGC